MYNKKLFYLLYITLLFTTIYGGNIIKKDEVLKLTKGEYYCKGDDCVLYSNNSTTIEIPNKEGKNINYITEVCTISKINSGECNSAKCTTDLQCLSNVCEKGHCAFDPNNPKYNDVIYCQVVTEDIDSYKGEIIKHHEKCKLPEKERCHQIMRCGLPNGVVCSYNSQCSSNNCNQDTEICIEKKNDCYDDCNSISFITYAIIAIISIVIIVGCFVVYCLRNRYSKKSNKDENENSTI